MRDFTGFVDKNPVVGTHATVNHANIGCDERDLGERGRVNERRGRFLFGGENDPICRFIRNEHGVIDKRGVSSNVPFIPRDVTP